MSCFPNDKTSSASPPYMPATSNPSKKFQGKKRPAPPPPITALDSPIIRNTKKSPTSNAAVISAKRVSKLYKSILKHTTVTAVKNSSNTEHDPTYGFASRYSDSKSYFRTHNIDNTIPTTVSREDLFDGDFGNANFRDVLFPLRSSGGSNKSAKDLLTTLPPGRSLGGKENIAVTELLPPQKKRVKFIESKDSSYSTAIGEGDFFKSYRKQQNQEPYRFPGELATMATTAKSTLRSKIYEFFANLF